MAIPCPTRRHAATIGVVSALLFTTFAPAGAAPSDDPTARLQKAPVAPKIARQGLTGVNCVNRA